MRVVRFSSPSFHWLSGGSQTARKILFYLYFGSAKTPSWASVSHYGIYCTNTFEDITFCSMTLWFKWIYIHFQTYGKLCSKWICYIYAILHLCKLWKPFTYEGILCLKTKTKPNQNNSSIPSPIPCCKRFPWFFRILHCPYSDGQGIDVELINFLFHRINCSKRKRGGGGRILPAACAWQIIYRRNGI